MKKVMISLISIALLTVAIMIPVSAAVNPTIQPQWDNTGYVNCFMSFEGSTGYAESLVKARPGASSIKTDIIVYKQLGDDWIYVTELHDIKNKMVSGVSCSFDAEVGATYRADYTFTVTKAGIDEVVTRTMYKTY